MDRPAQEAVSPRLNAGSASSLASSESFGWVIVALLWAVACLNYLDRLMLVSMRDSVKASIPMTDAQFGLLTSMFLWVYGTLSPLGGFIADRYSRKWVIVGSLAVWSVVTWLTGHVHTYAELVTARALMGISEAFYIPAGLALISDWHRSRTRSLATGIHMSGLYTGAALGGLGGYISEQYGWRQGFDWFGIAGVSYAVVLILFLREHRDAARVDEPPPGAAATVSPGRWREAIGELFGNRSFLALLVYLSLAAIASWGVTGWLPAFLKERFAFTAGKAGLSATGYSQVGAYIGVLAGGIWADRWAQGNPRGRIYVPVIGFCAGGPCLFLLTGSGGFSMAITAMLLYGVARGFCDANTMPILCQVVGGKYRATGYGFLNFFSTLAGGAMIWAGGLLIDARVGLTCVFQLSAAAVLLAALALMAVHPRGSGEKR